jgi:class 3 adenylate cyclase
MTAVQIQHRTLSVGFADMDGFMHAVEGQSEEAIAAFLQQSYEGVGDAVVRHGGRVWKYLGDAVLFSCDTPDAATKAAHEIAAQRFKIGQNESRFHVGVATGPVVLGTFGHASFRNEDFFGHTIHRAATLSNEAKRAESHVALDPTTQAATA